MEEHKKSEDIPTPEPQAAPEPLKAPPARKPEPTRFGDWEINGRCIDF